MTKKEQTREINRKFYQYVEEEFPMYELNFDEGGGRVYLIPINTTKEGDDSIEYHQSRHEVTCLKWANDKVKEHVKELKEELEKSIIPYVKYVQ